MIYDAKKSDLPKLIEIWALSVRNTGVVNFSKSYFFLDFMAIV